jgi:toxin YoeB
MKLLWTEQAWRDYLTWQETDKQIVGKVNRLLGDVRRNPYTGLGKPEPLRGNLSGWWSRRITGDHRLIYRIIRKGEDQRMEIVACRYHYGDG